jgi:UDP-N-acetylglucosamine 1-carboxyvinyltransferase
MASFVVRQSGPLSGTLRAGGAKNSALKLMAACLLAEGRHVLSNVPRITDVEIMADLLRATGATVTRADRTASAAGTAASASDDPPDLIIDVPPDLVPVAPYELVEKMRASIVLLGPLLARTGEARFSLPGGDDFGSRPIDIHLGAFEAMGARFDVVHGYIEAEVGEPRPAGRDARVGRSEAPGRTGRDTLVGQRERLVGTKVVLEYPSHTATDNVLMAATLAKGTTVIENAAREPEVVDLARMLRSMGARIEGAGTSLIEVEGVDELSPASHRVIPDRVVAATYMAAVGLAGGDVTIEDARPDHMDMLIRKLGDMGLLVSQGPEGLRARSQGRLRSVDLATLPYPGVATDYKPFVVTMLAVADGVGIVTENLFEGRFRYVEELRRMGADITTEGHHAVVRGVERLSGAPVKAPDLRGGAALVLAGLAAEGETVVSAVEHIERGYEDLPGKLRSVGALVERR